MTTRVSETKGVSRDKRGRSARELYLVQPRVPDMVEAAQQTGGQPVAASPLAQLIALQARHGRRRVAVVTASVPANECPGL